MQEDAFRCMMWKKIMPAEHGPSQRTARYDGLKKRSEGVYGSVNDDVMKMKAVRAKTSHMGKHQRCMQRLLVPHPSLSNDTTYTSSQTLRRGTVPKGQDSCELVTPV